MPLRFRPLLPADESFSSSVQTGPSSSSSTTEASSHASKRKRVNTSTACDECRRRKARCDGQTPSCSLCLKRNAQCHYTTKQSRGIASEASSGDARELLDLLKSAPTAEAHHLLELLREHREDQDPATLLAMVRGEQAGSAGPVTGAVPSRVVGGTQSGGLEAELLARNPAAFPAELKPITASAIQRAGAVQTPQQSVSLRRTRSADQRAINDTQPTLLTDEELVTPSPLSELPFCPDIDPFLEFQRGNCPREDSPKDLCDARLEHVDIGHWVDLPIPKNLAAHAISFYLKMDHPLLGTFDPDLFLTDLANDGGSHCSRFLVHAVLYWAFQMYSALNPDAAQFVPSLGSAAQEIHEEEKSTDSLNNLASLQLLGLAYMGQGKDHLVLKYMAEANRMGKRMHLFGVAPSISMRRAEELSEDERRPYSFAAWGIFNWIVLMSLFYQQPGVDFTEHPPSLPIPGTGSCTALQSPSASDEDIVHEPRSIIPHYMGETLPALCRFWRIIHGVTLEYYRDLPSRSCLPSRHISLEFAEQKYRELIAWAETLPKSLLQSETSPHHVVIFHIWFHAAILDIFRPFMLSPGSERLRLKTFSARKSSPAAAYKASVNQLKRLIVVFRSRYDSSAYSMLWHTALIYVANAVLHDTADPEWRFYFLLCIYGYENLRRSYRLAEVIGRGLLTMTLRDGEISGREAREILRQVAERGLTHAAGDTRATFMVDLDLAMTNPEEAKVERLASQFEDMAMFQELTNMDNIDTVEARASDGVSEPG